MSRCSSLETNKKVLERKNKDLENGSNEAKTTLINNRDDFENIQKEFSIALNQHKQNEKKLMDKVNELEYEAEQHRSLFIHEKQNLMQEKNRFENKVFELEQRYKEMQNDHLAKVEAMASIQENERGETRDEMQKILKENSILKSHLNNATKELKHLKVSQSELIDRLKRKCELYDLDVNRMTHEKEEMTKLIITNERIMHDLKLDLESCERKLNKADGEFSSTNEELKKSTSPRTAHCVL